MRKLHSTVLGLGFAFILTDSSARAQSFDDVWAIMTQDRGSDSPGCRGCHIVPQPPQGLIWGDSEDEVLQSLQTPDPVSGVAVVDCGNYGSKISVRLECGSMPFFGRRWHEGPDDPDHPDEFFQYQLEKLRTWLAQFDDPSCGDLTSCP